MRSPRAGPALLAAVLAGFLASCGPRPVDDLRRAAPGLAADMAHHLVQSDDAHLRAFCRDIGFSAVENARSTLLAAPPTESTEAYARTARVVHPYLGRLAGVMAVDFGMDREVERFRALTALSLEQQLEVARLLGKPRATQVDTRMSLEEKERACRRLIDEFLEYEMVLNLGDLYGYYAELLPRLKRDEEVPQYLRLGIEHALRTGQYATACQLLGVLGTIHRRTGDYESMRACWDQALALARRMQHWQEARIYCFYATYHRDRGQLTIARDLLVQAQQTCRERKAYGMEIRFLLDTLRFYSDLGCWDIVGEGLEQAELLLRENRRHLSEQDNSIWRARVARLRARLRSATGDCAGAEKMFAWLEEETGRLCGHSPDHARVFLDRGVSSAHCGEPRGALQHLHRGLQQCEQYGVSELVPQFHLAIAAASMAAGDASGCSAALDTFRAQEGTPADLSDVRLWMQHDVLRVRAALAKGERLEVIAGFRDAFQRLERYQAEMRTGSEGYLVLNAATELRELAHQVLAASPEAGYAFELAWRGSFRKPRSSPASPGAGVAPMQRCADIVCAYASWPDDGRTRPQAAAARADVFRPGEVRVASVASVEPPAAEVMAEWRAMRARLADRRAIHCTYHVGMHEIVRWTATGTGLRRDVLRLSPGDLASRVARVRGVLASRPPEASTPPAKESIAQLYELARDLLPVEVMSGAEKPALVAVTPDGILCQLPFEALTLSASEYEPLSAQADVAWVRFVAAREPGRGRGVVVSDPRYPEALVRRYSILASSLPHGAVETAAVRAAFPDATVLEQGGATRQELERVWERARFLYFASHVIRDPQVPYLTFAPLSRAASGRDDKSYLEIPDILAADLSNCDLVVLSGCSSGATYVEPHAVAPSLGEAFLDAGAGAVVHTAWDVSDEHAAALMREFVQAWIESADPIAALGEARRRLRGARGTHPHYEAAYSIVVGAL